MAHKNVKVDPDLLGSVNQVDSVALSTLALNTGVIRAGPVVTRGGKCLSARAAMTIFGLTAGDGPWLFGVMNTDFNLAELETYLELNGPVSPNDKTAQEIASRGKFIRTLGLITPHASGLTASAYVDNQSLAGLKYSESGEAAGWTWWLYNRGPAMQTGATWALWSSVFVQWNKSG